MQVLIVYPYVPYPLNRGTYHRVFNLARELARYHQVDLFCLDDAESHSYKKVFDDFCQRVFFQPFKNPAWPPFFPDRLLRMEPATIGHWASDAARKALREFVQGRRYDLVHFCDLVMWQYMNEVDPGPMMVMDRSRVDLLFQKEELANLKLGLKEKIMRRENLWKLRRYERTVARRLTATVVCGPEDEIFMRNSIPDAGRIKVLANGVDEAFFCRSDFPPQPDPEPTVLFCGAMDYSPNCNGISWYFENCDAELLKRVPDRKVLIVGKNPLPAVKALAEIRGVEVTGEVPDVRPYYQRAWLQMVPLLIGGGTRLKIVESLSLGTPVLSTTIGAQGLKLKDGKHLLLADTPQDFTTALARMLQDGALRKSLAEEGRARVLDMYTWRKLGSELNQYYKQLPLEMGCKT